MSKKERLRKTEIRNVSLMILITFLIGIVILGFYFTKVRKQYLTYYERGDVQYQVRLKDNEFYKEVLDENQGGYVAELIESIPVAFSYKLDFNNRLAYRYSYKIIAEVEVEDKITKTNIYHYSEELRSFDLAESSGILIVSDDVVIDYQKYNNIIYKFKDIYDLSNVTAKLNVYLVSNVQNIEKSNTVRFVNQKISGVSIPLSEKVIAIESANYIVDTDQGKLELTSVNNYYWIVAISLMYLGISIIYGIYLILYMERTKTAKMIYEKEIRSIMNNYDNYIQRITGSYDIGTSQVLKIESFSDMLEIRDTLKQPILMLENQEKDGTFFIIPATNSIIYTYALRVVDIKAKMDGNEIPTYDITEIPHSDFVKKKKYTDEYIKEQITMTKAMPVVDEKNVIKGTKNKEEDLYDQLEMTRSFDIKEIKKAALESKKKAKQEKKEKKTTTKKVEKEETKTKSTKKKA